MSRQIHHRLLFAWLLLVMLNLWSGAETYGDNNTSSLDTRIKDLVQDFNGDVGIYAKNLHTGRTYTLAADDLFATASVCKVPVMIELFRRVEAGEIRWDNRRKLAQRGISRNGTGLLKHLRDEPEMTLRDYCRLMITVSDNMATDTLMQIANPQSVSATMKRLGFDNTRVSGNMTVMHYKMAGINAVMGSAKNDALMLKKARAGDLVPAGLADRTRSGNVTTPREMGRILEKLYRGEIVSATASVQMIDILKGTTDRTMIPHHISPETAVAHKVGGTWRVRADVGIVYQESGPLLLTLFSYHHPTEKRSRDLLANIADVLIQSMTIDGSLDSTSLRVGN